MQTISIFDPEDIARMRTALEMACAAHFGHTFPLLDIPRARELIAKQIVRLAQLGETDPDVLSSKALARIFDQKLCNPGLSALADQGCLPSRRRRSLRGSP